MLPRKKTFCVILTNNCLCLMIDKGTLITILFPFRSRLTEGAKLRLPAEYIDIYERVWDESDYVIPPSENNAFFVMTNVVLTPNQTRTTCPEDPGELPEVICGTRNETTGEVNITQGVCVKGQLTVKCRWFTLFL